MPELRHLRCFVVAAEELNFTRAAARLYVVQQSLSATIKQLELELGVRLFDRTTHDIRLTDAGRAFLPGARRVLEEAEAAFASVSGYTAGSDGIVVGFSFTLDEGTRWLLLQRFVLDNPVTRLSVHTGFAGELLDRRQARELDLAVVFCPEERAGVETEEVVRVPVCVVLARGHPAAAKPTLRLAELRDEPFALAAEPQGAGFNAWLMETCRAAGFTPATVVSPPVTMSLPISEMAPGAITLAPYLPTWEATGSIVRPLEPEISVPYAVAIRAGTSGYPRRAFDAIVAAGPDVEEAVRRGGPRQGAVA